MNNSVTSATYVRKLNYSLVCKLSDFLDPQDRWKEVITQIRKPSGEQRYTQQHVWRFEGLVSQRKSPTVELLNDWGTTNCTVGELVDILVGQKLLAAASLLLPDTVEALVAEVPHASPKAAPALPVMVAAAAAAVPVAAGSELPTRVLDDREPPPRSTHTQESWGPAHTHDFSNASYEELVIITGNFDDRPVSAGGCKLGEGGFGTVYKGLLNGKLVAVKKLKPMEDISLDELQVQFDQEIRTLKALKHDNLVDMIGFCSDGPYPCLVYAFMANGSLLDRLACLDQSVPLSWRRRCLIAEGTALGLEYLHSNHHVHRDVKSGNILLDENFVAKLSDFGLTRASEKRTSATVMTERIMGTCAYMAPEALRGQITPKSDVFSFGVVLLEILSGLPPADEKREPQFLMEMIHEIEDEEEELTLQAFLDGRMRDCDLGQVETLYSLASNCLCERKDRRPLIMQVVAELKGVIKSISLE